MTLPSELRHRPRLRSELRVEVQRVEPVTGIRHPLHPGRVENVSATGLQLALDDPALRGERLRVRIPLTGEPLETVDAELWISWCRANPDAPSGRYVCGAEYDPPEQPAAQRVLYFHRGHAAA